MIDAPHCVVLSCPVCGNCPTQLLQDRLARAWAKNKWQGGTPGRKDVSLEERINRALQE